MPTKQSRTAPAPASPPDGPRNGRAGGQDRGQGRGQGRGGHREHHDHAAMIADYRRRFFVSIVLTVPILALSPLIQGLLGLEEAFAFAGDRYVLFALASAVYFYGGWPFLVGLFREAGQRQPGMMTLIGIAISAAYFYSVAVTFGLAGEVFYWELATLIDVMLLGHWIEMRSVMGASGALEKLVRLMPDTAHRLTEGGGTEDVSVTEIGPGDRVLVRPGEKVPTDGVVIDGSTNVNQAMLTGESRPVEKGEGDEVMGGAINGDGAITLRVEKTGADTYLSQVVDMVRQAQESRSRSQDMANRAAGWLTYAAVGIGTVTLVFWLAAGAEFQFALARMVTVMVITCPHALGLAVPLVVAVSTSLAAKGGLLIRDRQAFERARNLDAVIFDKTGTLTEGRFGVSDVVALGDRSEDDVLVLAATLESQSEHPIAAGIVRAARDRGLAVGQPKGFETLKGRGAKAEIDGRTVKVASPGHLSELGLDPRDDRIGALREAGKTVVFVLDEDRLVGAIALSDIVRDVSRQAVADLKAMGVRCIMLTGDAQAVATSVARELGLDEVFAEVLPDQKAAKVREVKEQGRIVAMVGDGVNDAPALLEADLGIAIGAGTDVAVESADIVLVRDDPRDVVSILALSRATWRKMIENFILATGYNVVAIPLAAGVAFAWGILLSPAVGAALMSASTVIVAINAKLLERAREVLPASARQ